ncbi:MAG: DUF4113 domain-containing protein [Acidocella sp.]|nr:DUF4113 domain-containing protein [Acidocella sp.]
MKQSQMVHWFCVGSPLAAILHPAATGTAMSWASRQARHSPRYTTRVEEMLVAKAF